MTGLVPRDGLPPVGSSLVRARASAVLSSGRKPPRRVRSARGVPRPPFASGSFPAYPPSSRITNTRVTGYRTLAALASDSPPRASRYGVASAKTRRASTRRDRPRPRWARPDKPTVQCQFRLIGQRPRTHRARNLSPASQSFRPSLPQPTRPAERPNAPRPPIQSTFLPSAAPPLFSWWQPQRALKGRIAHVLYGGVLVGLPP